MSNCPDCTDGKYRPLFGPAEDCQTCGGTMNVAEDRVHRRGVPQMMGAVAITADGHAHDFPEEEIKRCNEKLIDYAKADFRLTAKALREAAQDGRLIDIGDHYEPKPMFGRDGSRHIRTLMHVDEMDFCGERPSLMEVDRYEKFMEDLETFDVRYRDGKFIPDDSQYLLFCQISHRHRFVVNAIFEDENDYRRWKNDKFSVHYGGTPNMMGWPEGTGEYRTANWQNAWGGLSMGQLAEAHQAAVRAFRNVKPVEIKFDFPKPDPAIREKLDAILAQANSQEIV